MDLQSTKNNGPNILEVLVGFWGLGFQPGGISGVQGLSFVLIGAELRTLSLSLLSLIWSEIRYPRSGPKRPHEHKDPTKHDFCLGPYRSGCIQQFEGPWLHYDLRIQEFKGCFY